MTQRIETWVACPVCREGITCDLTNLPAGNHYNEARKLASQHDDRCAQAFAEGLRG